MTTATDNTELSSIPDDRPTGVNGSKLAGRVALVPGGTRGIGAAIGFSLASHGAEIAAGFSGNIATAEQFAGDFAQRFGSTSAISVHQGNVASAEDCRRVISEVLRRPGMSLRL